ncbi:hypothetical protein ABMA27_009357 [Loxostege sticticalis]|uniref:Uncharacterized protein n=1 Tax=Loxostege sticticalis TaxID=481309 RepID=A0ABR3H7P0_LOXSC
MDESEDNMSSEDIKVMVSPSFIKSKPKKRSLVERELETNLTARVTSPMTNGDNGSTSRYGRARRLKNDADYIDTEKGIKMIDSPSNEKTPVKIQSPVYKMHASNSPIKKEPKETPKKIIITDSSLENQIENIYNENISLSRFGSEEKKHKSPGNKLPKVYVRKDLIQTREKEEYVMMIKNMFSPNKSSQKSNSHLNNILERSSEKYSLNTSMDDTKSHNGFINNSSVVKTLDFDSNKKKKKENRDGRVVLSKSDLFELEAKCEYQVGDLAWARMGTYPFWPCIVTREPASGMFVKKKLFGRIERDIIHVTFFGDNGRRGWIVDTMLRKFLGQLEFEATRENFSPSAKKRDPRLYAAFFVSEKKMPQWNISVEEAETLLREPKRLRIDILYDMLAKTRSTKSTPKQHKSGKITRTASDVASDVSLSESLYDTLFSEDDGKSEDTERSRSKPRMSLDVSEVVTACLDNMAAKTGITKIQRQSHMDRWLQKAKSKTPEKSQVNLPPPQKEKEVKVASAKKKKKISPANVPIQKPYSFRKTSYEPQILKSHDNEHDYTTKVSDNPPQTGDDNGASHNFGLVVKVESLSGKDGMSDNTDTKGDRTTDDIDITDSETPKGADTDVTTQNTANETTEIGPIDITEEPIDEIQENICSVEENEELLLGHTDKPAEISQKVNNLSTDQVISITIDADNQSQSTKIPEEENKDEENQVKIAMQVDEPSICVRKSLEITEIPQTHKMDVDSTDMVETPSENNTDKEKSIEDPAILGGPNVDKPIEKQVEIGPISNRIRTRASANNKMNAEKVVETKVLSDSMKKSAEFVKYLELRQDAVMDEHPELSQEEIEDYLYKTWQYEESAKTDFKKDDDVKLSGVAKALNSRQRPHKKCLSLNSNASKKHIKKREEDRSTMNSFISSTSAGRSLRTRLSNSPVVSEDANKKVSPEEISSVEAIRHTHLVNEHSNSVKIIKITPKLDEPRPSTSKTRLSNSAAKRMDPEDKINSAIKENKIEKHPEITQKLNGQGLHNTQMLECDMNKEKAETTPIAGSTSARRSLRTRLSNSPCTSMDATETITRKESSTVGTVKTSQIVTEHSDIQTKSEVTPNNDDQVQDTPKRSECCRDKDKIKTTPVVDGTPVRRSLRKTRLSNSTAVAVETNAIISSVSKESSTVKSIESTQIEAEPSCSGTHSKMSQKLDEHESDKRIQVAQDIKTAKNLVLCNTSTEKQTETTQVADEPTIDKEEIQIMDENSKDSKKPAETTLLTKERSVETENQIDILQVTGETSRNIEHVANAETENILNTDSHDLDPNLPIEITTFSSESCMDTEKSGQTEVVPEAESQIEKPHETTEVTDQYNKDTESSLEVTKTATGHSIDSKIETYMIEHADAAKPIVITQITEQSNICTENQTEMTPVVNEQLTKNDQVVTDEDKEYGHLDFVFSSIDEKLLATNDISKPVIINNEIVSVKDIKNAESIAAKSIENVQNCSKVILEGRVSENVESKSKETTIKNLDKCKYKNLYDSCNELSVHIERLPRLRRKIINIKDLDKEIVLCKARQNGVVNKIDFDDKNSTVANEITAGNGHVEATCNFHTTDTVIQNVSTTINNETNESKMSVDDESFETDEKVKGVIDQKLTIEENNKSEYPESEKNGVFDEKVSPAEPQSNENDKSINSHLKTLPKDHRLPNVISTENKMMTVDCPPVPIENSKTVECLQIKLSPIVNENVSPNKDHIEHSEDNLHLQPVATTHSETIKFPQSKPSPVVNEHLLPNRNHIEHNQDKVKIQPVVVVKSENAECHQIKPSPLLNGFQYIYDDDDEEEFESPAFSPIFKEPINPTPYKKEDEIENNNDSKAVTDKNDTNKIDSSSKDGSNESPFSKQKPISTANKTFNSIKREESNVEDDKDELMTSVSRLPEPVKINGFHQDEEYGIDFSDNDFNVETSSINSEDSEPLSLTKSKLLSKNRKNAKKALHDVEFVKYLELNQDALMDEHPELNQEEIVEYLYKTWQYEENSKSEIRKNDDIEQLGLVKGLHDNLRQKSIRNSYRENKKRNKKRDDDDNLSIDSNISTKRSKKGDDDTLSINSDVSDTSIRRRLRTRFSNSPAISIDENEFSASKESSPERKPDIEDKMSVDSDDSIKITKRKVRNQILDDSLDGDEQLSELKSKDKSPVNKTVKTEESRPKRSLDKKENKSPKSYKDSKIEKYFGVVNASRETTNDHDNEMNTLDVDKKIKEEYDPETVSISSMNSEDSEVSLSKRKQRRNAEKQTAKSMDDPEFLKYVELRQDTLIDENPQLTQEEIVAYLYKTWLYEESVKSDLKKSDDIEQANLVKGLNSDVQPKRVKKKIKVEKTPIDEEAATKDKPKRKISQPYYNEDTISDIEDEIELFEIFKTKKNAIKSEETNGEIKKTSEVKSNEHVKTESEETVIQDEVDEVELYFSQLPLPKPNIFKGLVREKVCEICEKTGNLVKCKGCSCMFHVDCDMKEQEKEAVVASTRGRKKKKKPGRKPKNFEDSGSHSDEKSQDISEENNVSIEEVETEPRVVDEAVLEAALSAKMKEIMPTIDLTYDSYSSDDGLDWDSAPPGHCEIVDVKIKPKIVVDYSDFKCKNCQKYTTPVCFVCKEAVSKTGVDHRQKCQTNHCNKYYHLECLDHWPQTQYNSGEPSKNNKKNEHFEAVVCPRHVCHTCVSDDPRGCRTRFSGDKLARCVRCPATYHSFTKCLPAGTQILTGSLIVCPRHYEHRPGKVPCHVNTGWCFICALGGSLICCEYCPTSFHAECLNIKPPEGGYMCEDCETGRLPLYGEMVWVKLGHYRWWPGIILHPSEIPENILAVKHSPGEFVVRFFGQYDHYWVNRGRVFPFQEGDSGRISTQKSKIDAAFITAMEHAHRAFEILKTAEPNDEESLDIASSLLPPHYVKLKVNKPCGSLVGWRPDIEESSLTQCECDPMVEDPCGPYSHCLNRMLLTECGPICRAGDRCLNRAFEKRLYPKMVPYRTPHRGWGLKTLEDIKAGQFVIEYVGELIDEEEFRRRMNRMHEIRDENFYFLTLDKERMIDAGPKGNLARFMNHCCEPNCETQKWTVLGDVRVGLFAINDIPANSELTFNYNLECAGIEKKRCLCGARRCSGYIGAKPKQEESQPKKKRAYKKRAKPVEESPSTSKNKPKRPVGRPAKPRELTDIEKDLLIIKNATNGLSSDSESSSRLSSIDNLNPKALKRKRVSFSTEESVCSSPSTKKSRMEDSSPSSKKARMEDSSPSTKKAKSEDSFSTKKAKIEDNSPNTKKAKIEDSSPSTKEAKIEENSPSTMMIEESEVGD